MAREISSATEGRALLTIEQTAEQTGLSRSTIYRLLASQELRSVKIGRRRCIPRQALDSFIDKTVESGHASTGAA